MEFSTVNALVLKVYNEQLPNYIASYVCPSVLLTVTTQLQYCMHPPVGHLESEVLYLVDLVAGEVEAAQAGHVVERVIPNHL